MNIPLMLSRMSKAQTRELASHFGVRLCPKCKEYKSISLFYDVDAKNGEYSSYCVECSISAAKQYNIEHREEINAKRRVNRPSRAKKKEDVS